MIGVIFGEKGTGKTKHILEMANKSAKEAKGSLVFIDSDNSYMYDLSNKIRFVNATEYGITMPKMLYGFICGMAAMDFDLEYIFIDGLISIVHKELDTLALHFGDIQKLAQERGINVIIAVNGNEKTIPSFLLDYVMHTT